jgi:hypothetical protein
MNLIPGHANGDSVVIILVNHNQDENGEDRQQHEGGNPFDATGSHGAILAQRRVGRKKSLFRR